MLLAVSQTAPVRCVNCGSSDHAVALIGVIIAAAAFVVSVAALYIALREHRVFTRQLTARAKFNLTATVRGGSPDGVIEVERSQVESGATFVGTVVEIGLNNVGSKPAGPTTINVLAPQDVRQLGWANSAGEKLPQHPPTLLMGGEMLDVPDLGDRPAQYISAELPRVKLRTPEVRWVTLVIDTRYPVAVLRIKAQSDDLPDDQVEEVLDYVVRVKLVDSLIH